MSVASAADLAINNNRRNAHPQIHALPAAVVQGNADQLEFRHPGESRDPVFQSFGEELDSGFRRNDNFSVVV